MLHKFLTLQTVEPFNSTFTGFPYVHNLKSLLHIILNICKVIQHAQGQFRLGSSMNIVKRTKTLTGRRQNCPISLQQLPAVFQSRSPPQYTPGACKSQQRVNEHKACARTCVCVCVHMCVCLSVCVCSGSETALPALMGEDRQCMHEQMSPCTNI